MLQEKLTFSRLIQGVMSWGVWGAKMNTSQMANQIASVFKLGITTFDHADIYGGYTTETQFGKAFTESGINREDIQLISKLGIQYLADERPQNFVKHYQYDSKYIIETVEKSLQNLQTDYLDLLLLHRPSPLMDPKDIQVAIGKLKSEGKVKAFGVSNFSNTQTDLIKKFTDVSVNQIECSLTHYDAIFDGSLDKMLTEDIVPMAWSPLGTVFKEDTQQTKRIHSVLDRLTKKYRISKDQLLLAWLLQHPATIHPVIGTTKTKRVSSAIDALGIKLDLQDWFELLVASQGYKVP